MTPEEKMIYAAAFGAEFARLAANDIIETYLITDYAREVARKAVASFRLIDLDKSDWRGDRAMLQAMR